jgi:hypothetical protein
MTAKLFGIKCGVRDNKYNFRFVSSDYQEQLSLQAGCSSLKIKLKLRNN